MVPLYTLMAERVEAEVGKPLAETEEAHLAHLRAPVEAVGIVGIRKIQVRMYPEEIPAH
jgi:hypothetical protein